MTPQECILDTVLRARGILSEYIEPGPQDCHRTISRLFSLLDDQELTTALNLMNLEAVRSAMTQAATVKISPAALSSTPRAKHLGEAATRNSGA